MKKVLAAFLIAFASVANAAGPVVMKPSGAVYKNIEVRNEARPVRER